MTARAKISAEETAELQRLYSELPWAIAEASAEAARAERPPGRIADDDDALDGDEKVDTIIKRIVQLTQDAEDED